eukprot:gene27369-30936_t
MTIRKTASITPQRGLGIAAITAMAVSLTGCGMISSVVGQDKVDYKSAKKASTLDVPPDLTQLQADNRYSLPDSTRGVATASGYQAQRAAGGTAAAPVGSSNQVATTGTESVKVMRAGNQRWLVVKQGTDAALAMAMGHVILKEFHTDGQSKYFKEYAKQYTDFPMLVLLKEHNGHLAPDYFLRASHLDNSLDETNNPEWKTLVIDEASGAIVAPAGSIGFRWGESGKWNLEMKQGGNGQPVDPQLSLLGAGDEVLPVAFPYFGGKDASDVLLRNVPVKRLTLADGSSALVATLPSV